MSNRAILKGFFETGDTPTQVLFYDLIDSMFNKLDDSISWADVAGKPTTFVPSAHGHPWGDISGKPSFFSGAYSDLSGKPTLFSGDWADITSKPSTFAPSAHNHAASEVTSGVFAPARLASGTTTNGYMIQLVAGVPTWVAAPSGGGTPAGASGQVQFNTGGAFAASSNFFWDATNNRLGIGTSSPSYALDINGTARIQTVPTIIGATKMLVKDPTTGQVSEQLVPSGGSGWGLTGNAGTTAGTNFVGTTDAARFDVRSNNIISGKFYSNGSVALLEEATTTAYWAFAAGYQANAAGQHAVALSYGAQATGTSSMAFGQGTHSTHYNSVAIGVNMDLATQRAGQTLIGGYAGIDFQVVSGVNAFRVMTDGTISAPLTPTYANEAAAAAAGLLSNTIYKTATGELRIKL